MSILFRHGLLLLGATTTSPTTLASTTLPPTTIAPTTIVTTISPTTLPPILYTLDLSDSITLTDLISLELGLFLNLSDAITLIDASSKIVNKSLTDVITLTDILSKESRIYLNDIIALIDISSKTAGKSISDIITLMESYSKIPGKSLSDTITLSDTNIKSFRKPISDSITLAGVISKILNIRLSDIIHLNEKIYKGVSKPLADVILMSDEIEFSPLPFIPGPGLIFDWTDGYPRRLFPDLPFSYQGEKPHYNEAESISDKAIAPWKTPDLFAHLRITPIHNPWCGYWYAGPGGGGVSPKPIGIELPWPWNPPNPYTAPPIPCEGGTIEYTTLFMLFGDSQDFGIVDQDSGYYVWAVEGGGSINPITGLYTAPPIGSCDLFADIVLYCNGAEMDRITISFPVCTGTIHYDTLQMDMSDSQTLYVLNPVADFTYHWELVGIGSLSSDVGQAVQYTTPETNPECETSAIVYLSCCGMVDSIEITFPECTGTIQYSTLHMYINQQQTLLVQNPIIGCVYNWAIMSGGGSLSANEGSAVQYTAPATNPSCNLNPTITLKTCPDGEVVELDEITIAINASDDVLAYQIGSECQSLLCIPDPNCPGQYCTCPPPDCFIENCQMLTSAYGCDGSFTNSTVVQKQVSYCQGPEGTCQQISITNDNNGIPHSWIIWCSEEPIDIRTPAMILAGCCPEALM